jgi:hypothetical protein
METNIGILVSYLEKVCQKIRFSPKRGSKHTYSSGSFIVFFVIMAIKRVYTYKGMYKYAQNHYTSFGWLRCPTRKTIKTRFEALPTLLQVVIPEIALHFASIHKSFDFKWGFVDKSVFRSLGGIWHQKHMKEGLIPHSSIDIEASWAKSDYHGWRFGYGLHLIVNQFRFPIAATVATASDKDYSFVEKLINRVHHKIGIIVGDKGYFSSKIIELCQNTYQILLQTNKIFAQPCSLKIAQWYNDLVQTVQAQLLYACRKPSIEPTFSLIKEFFNLNSENQLPYKGLNKVSAYLLTCTVSIQLMMYHNYRINKKLGDTTIFRTFF